MGYKIIFIVSTFLLISCATKLSIQYEVVKRVNSEKVYRDFLQQNPDSRYSKEAMDKLQLLIINTAIREKDAFALVNFLQDFPSSPYINTAIRARENLIVEKVFEEVKAENTLKGYINFIEKYPENSLIKEAEKLYLQKYQELSASEDLNAKIDNSTEDNDSERPLERGLIRINNNGEIISADQFLAGIISGNQRVGLEEEIVESQNIINRDEALTTGEKIKTDSNIGLKPQKKPEVIEDKIVITETAIIPIKETETTIIDANELDTSPVLEKNPLFLKPKNFSGLIDDSSYPIRGSREKLIYEEIFHPDSSPRIIQPNFSFFVKKIQRTNAYIRLTARFHNLKKIEQNFKFSRITLVNNQGRRVKPIEVRGTNWDFFDGLLKSSNIAGQVTELDFLFPSLDLFSVDQYTLYITLNKKNYLLQI